MLLFSGETKVPHLAVRRLVLSVPPLSLPSLSVLIWSFLGVAADSGCVAHLLEINLNVCLPHQLQLSTHLCSSVQPAPALYSPLLLGPACSSSVPTSAPRSSLLQLCTHLCSSVQPAPALYSPLLLGPACSSSVPTSAPQSGLLQLCTPHCSSVRPAPALYSPLLLGPASSSSVLPSAPRSSLLQPRSALDSASVIHCQNQTCPTSFTSAPKSNLH
ncbi:hypothetical protein WMY93_011182 [Mugilogobius chulae]|uniref:Uncharacterized protein n=1 Tax=Mugilogobius chulae TaxID=88201 RepID=A0AAW0PD02_9GOBI